jgi:Mg2+/Co2+ transporter CorB
MNKGLMRRVVILAAFIVALGTFVFNIATNGDILYSAFCAICVFLGVAIAMLFALKGVAKALLRHLKERQAIQQRAEMEELRKQVLQQQQQQQQQGRF